jgi:Fe-S-cluster containining protein
MSLIAEGITCENCTGECCKGPRTITLTDDERDQMRSVGTRLLGVVEPKPYPRERAPYPPQDFDFRSVDPEILPETVASLGVYNQLEAFRGLYIMDKQCGNLQQFLGREVCMIYDDRPAVCREFEAGGTDCVLMRAQAGIDEPLVTMQALLETMPKKS